MNLTIDITIIKWFEKENIKVYFYESGCEWTKVALTQDFNTDGLECTHVLWKNIYFEPKDALNLDGGKILPKPDKSEGHKSEDKYIFLSDKIKSRCGCATSFSFEKKLIDSSKLKKLKIAFKK